MRSGCGGLPQGCYCGKVFIIDNLMVDLSGLGSNRNQSAVTRYATVEDSLVKYLKFERVRLGLFFDISFRHTMFFEER